MAKDRRSILIVPPSGARIRFMRIRVGLVIVLCLFLLAGFVGYFIPFNSLTLDVVEQNQKKNLDEQNKKLLLRIHGMRRQLHTLNTRLHGLQRAKDELNGLLNVADKTGEEAHNQSSAAQSVKDFDDLLGKVVKAETFLLSLTEKLEDDPDYFSKAPIIKPVAEAADAHIIADFGPMRDPFTGAIKRHYGIDFAVPRETPVLATAQGTVISAEKHKFWGNRIQIRHNKGFTTVYAHLGSMRVGRGRRVDRGDVIGTVGISGLTTGPHLHYEIRLNGKAINPAELFFPEIETNAQAVLAHAAE